MDVQQILSQAVASARRGALHDAETLCRSVLARFPRHFAAWLVLGDVLGHAKRLGEAVAAYEAAEKSNPGHAVPFTRAAILRFRMAFGPPLPPRLQEPDSVGRRIQMTWLGSNGRFGNQLLQYGFVRLYAKQHDLIAEVPDWIGRDVFDLDDPLPTARLPRVDESEVDLFASLEGHSARVFSETDISGYFCGSTDRWGRRSEEFRALFKPGRKVRSPLDGAWAQLRSVGNTIVALHLRQTDFGYGRFWIAPCEWYLEWLRAIWATLDRPALYIATDDSSLVARFAEFSPWDASRFDVSIPGADFIIDHHMLRHAEHVAIANSTFSFTAAMLNTNCRSFVRPHPGRRELVSFHPWSADVLLDPVPDAGP